MLSVVFVGLLFFVGTYFTVRTNFYSVRRLLPAIRSIFCPGKKENGGITAFSSLCTTLAATIGTGNIVGVASAVVSGGPGALFWMLIGAVVSMMTKCAENVLAVLYSRRDGKGKRLGGPFFYMEFGLGKRFAWMGRLFAYSCLFAGVLGMGTVIQSRSIIGAVEQIFGSGKNVLLLGRSCSVSSLVTAAVVTVLTASVILGGAERIASFSAAVVPAMAVGYVVFCLVILGRNLNVLPQVLKQIVVCAFTPQAAGGAAVGLTARQVLLLGMQRGIFSNEAGLGTSPIAAASAEDGDARLQGYSGIVSVFIDTILLCTLTGLTVLVTGATGEDGVQTAVRAWSEGLPWPAGISRGILSAFLVVFGFTSILGWNFNVERCLAYLFHNEVVTKVYQALYLLSIFLAPFLSEVFAWKIADVTNALMAIPNLIALFLLRKQVLAHIT